MFLDNWYGFEHGGDRKSSEKVFNLISSDEPKTQKEFAESYGISQQTMNNYMRTANMIPELEDWVKAGIKIAPLVFIRRAKNHSISICLKSVNISATGRDWSALACDNPVSIMELNSSVVIESSVEGSFGRDNEKGMLLVRIICLYNALITTEAGNPSLDIIDSACSFTSGSTRASTFALLVAMIIPPFFFFWYYYMILYSY